MPNLSPNVTMTSRSHRSEFTTAILIILVVCNSGRLYRASLFPSVTTFLYGCGVSIELLSRDTIKLSRPRRDAGRKIVIFAMGVKCERLASHMFAPVILVLVCTQFSFSFSKVDRFGTVVLMEFYPMRRLWQGANFCGKTGIDSGL